MYDIINYIDCTAKQQKEIFSLRNLPEIRKWMTNPEIISWDNHLKFIELLRQNQNRKYYAIYNNGVLVGTYNLTNVFGTTWERGIITTPIFQGTGSTTAMELFVLNTLPKDKFQVITAKVKLNNNRSIHYHKKFGYKETYRDHEYIYYKMIL